MNLESIVRTWTATPFIPHAARKGEGVDCVHLCAEILREAGFIRGYSLPPYRCDQGHHAAASAVLAWLASHNGFAPVETDPQPGDVLCFRIGRVTHHVGLCLDGERFIHALRGRGVMFSTLRDPTYRKRFVAAYRPTQPL